ncbi:hypothetical protein EXIGLDRAFT_722325 [Exidia glandulosa HHB12029]|uniref:Uncharacterized protein n=1 Tax=Exidia glandulosa HHB12029 TaxID=1314781 RepID=A0A165N648_EXIGL|nr:hypothetical protein EXIGLDRAFT_722325 [Exidia glandulosa HHB12029]
MRALQAHLVPQLLGFFAACSSNGNRTEYLVTLDAGTTLQDIVSLRLSTIVRTRPIDPLELVQAVFRPKVLKAFYALHDAGYERTNWNDLSSIAIAHDRAVFLSIADARPHECKRLY